MKVYIDGKTYHISYKNKKLKPNEERCFFIWNMPAIHTCPYRTRLCEKLCYAVKAEKQYTKTCLPARKENFENSKADSFISDMVYMIERRVKFMRSKKLVVRIHESGDFYNAKYVRAWLEIAMHFVNDSRITFIAYTKSFVFFDGIKLPKNFSLRASIWADTNPEQLKIVLRNKWPIYTAVDKFTSKDKFFQCKCADCASCAACWNDKIKDIRCEIH